MVNRLSVKSKLILMLLLVSLLSATIVGFLGWRSSRRALSESIFTNITALRRSKAAQADAYFRTMRYTVETLSENDMVVEAMVRFNRSFRELENNIIPTEWDGALEAYYTAQFFPKLFANLPGQADYNLYRPQNQAGLYLQYHYIVANQFEDGQKLLLDQAADQSEYSNVHAYYHPRLRTVAQKLGFDDLILVNIETGDVVYTVSKQTDFGSNLTNGPYRRNNEAAAVELVRNNTERGTAHLVDFELYRPGYGAPTAFWSAPLYNGNHLVGVLMAQISLTALNKIMTDNQQWGQVGLGATGETYLVGGDHFMRSDARQRLEAPAAYAQRLAELGTAQQTAQLIDNLSTTILLQEVHSPAVDAALQNREGTEFATNYLDQAVLASYQPLVLEDLQWAVITEMAASEVFAPVYTFQRQLLIASVLLIVTLAFLTIGIASLFMRPLNLLVQGARAVTQEGAGQQAAAVEINITSQDEWGELATAFNETARGAQRQGTLLQAKEQELSQLLLNLLPKSAAQRLQPTPQPVLDQANQVTVGLISIAGVAAVAQQKPLAEVRALLQDLVTDLGETADRYDVEPLLTPTQQVIALCGLSTPHLDHSRRLLDFALALRTILQRLNTRHNSKLTLHCGIHTGPLSGSVVQTKKLAYELWGESVTGATQLAARAGADQILTSQAIYDRLHEQYTFQRPPEEQVAGARATAQAGAAWLLVRANSEGGA